jgi:hypothetical protein
MATVIQSRCGWPLSESASGCELSPGRGLGDGFGFSAARHREDRIRAVFGLTSGRSLPHVKQATLLRYYEHLGSRLSIPFDAAYCAEDGRTVREVTVVGLFSPTAPKSDHARGLLCLARSPNRTAEVPLVDLELEEDHPNFQLLEDYWYWVWNLRIDR